MRNECSIIRDMLPLYMEGLASADTVSFVDEHLEKCEACRAELEAMKDPNRLEKAASSVQADSAAPLKTFRRKWKRKKGILVCSTVIATIAAMCCALSAVEHFIYQEKIAVNGAVYLQTDGEIMELPQGSVELGYLRGISHRSTGEPMGDFMATNLDEKYGGCSIYQSGENEQIIYLEDYRGFYIPFELTELITQPEKEAE
ncbi:MAG: zf-HC2 domain-containing protein [Oscillibacter sp.]|nr:zf-HC2 domain-containing protein [Oscillibacter sp.]